ncbi:imidazole glycerol phosphate synthase subunit HisH [Methanosalsum natronophilum]|nr:imidazole glycerol phosphate synthase subunit HisH [Methanosalsum natronophilum]MCS3924338.1 glutamine amidotransferase [Methanosalsum natronophilum]
MKKITIIDYGLGNLRSVKKGLEFVGSHPKISSKPCEIINSDGLILPGVGAFSDAMNNIQSLRSTINDFIDMGRPVLGICLGQQLIMTCSEEGGDIEGLNIIPGSVRKFPCNNLKVPHMGWNSIKIIHDHPLFRGIENGEYLYFVHSYYVKTDIKHSLASCDYGLDFSASVISEKGNVIGTQFHPEKSGDAGLKILKNFVDMC